MYTFKTHPSQLCSLEDDDLGFLETAPTDITMISWLHRAFAEALTDEWQTIPSAPAVVDWLLAPETALTMTDKVADSFTASTIQQSLQALVTGIDTSASRYRVQMLYRLAERATSQWLEAAGINIADL